MSEQLTDTERLRAHRRCVSHLREQAARRAAEVVDGPPGLLGLFDADWPVSHTSNRVLATAALPTEVSTSEVLAFTDYVCAVRGLTHRKIDVLDEAVNLRLAPGLLTAGYAASPVLIMVALDSVEPTAGHVSVEVVDEEVVRGLVEEGWQLEAPDFSEETVRQLVGRRVAIDRAGDVTRLAVRDPRTGMVAAKADLVVIGGVAEIDDVLTLPDHRGRGYASALVCDAVIRARANGAVLVYLQAAEDDWPQHLYSRLGFVAVGRVHEHTLLEVTGKA